MTPREKIEQLITQFGEREALKKLLELQMDQLVQQARDAATTARFVDTIKDVDFLRAANELSTRQKNLFVGSLETVYKEKWLKEAHEVIRQQLAEPLKLHVPEAVEDKPMMRHQNIRDGNRLGAASPPPDPEFAHWSAQDIDAEIQTHSAAIEGMVERDALLAYMDVLGAAKLPPSVRDPLVQLSGRVYSRLDAEALAKERQQLENPQPAPQAPQAPQEKAPEPVQPMPEVPQQPTGKQRRYASEDAKNNAVNGVLGALRQAKNKAAFETALRGAEDFLAETYLEDEDIETIRDVMKRRTALMTKAKK